MANEENSRLRNYVSDTAHTKRIKGITICVLLKRWELHCYRIGLKVAAMQALSSNDSTSNDNTE